METKKIKGTLVNYDGTTEEKEINIEVEANEDGFPFGDLDGDQRCFAETLGRVDWPKIAITRMPFIAPDIIGKYFATFCIDKVKRTARATKADLHNAWFRTLIECDIDGDRPYEVERADQMEGWLNQNSLYAPRWEIEEYIKNH